MVTPGLYEHYKGPRYRVLFVAPWVWDGRSPVADALLLVIARPAPAVQIQAGGGLYGELLFIAKWSTNTNDVSEGLPIVIYVSLSEQGRVSARTVKEFEERVPTEATRPPRFQRIGD
jgi:hypothetical protein